MSLIAFTILFVSASGCLDFGKDYETTHPTEKQIQHVKTIMYLNQNIKLSAVGYKVSGSGIDAAVWFKFKINGATYSDIFDKTKVSIGDFKNNYSLTAEKNLQWWDVKDKKFVGGQVSLPDAKFMDVGIEKIKEGFMIYIFWFET
jgi:hypothetical protein